LQQLSPNRDVHRSDSQWPLNVDAAVRCAQILLKKSVIYCRWGDVVIQ
jgi:hypothetical protein